MENYNRSNKDVKKALVEATSKALGTAKMELGSRSEQTIPNAEGRVSRGGKRTRIGNYDVNYNNENSESVSWIDKIRNVKSRIVGAFAEDREGDWQHEANVKLMSREVYKLVDQLSKVMFDSTGVAVQNNPEVDTLKSRIKELILHEAQSNLSLNTESEAAGSEVKNIEAFVDDMLNTGPRFKYTSDLYIDKIEDLSDMMEDQRYAGTLREAGTNLRGVVASSAVLAASKGVVLATGAMAVPVVAMTDATMKLAIEKNAADANIDRRAAQEEEALNQEINYLLSPKESLGANPEGDNENETIPLYALKNQFDQYIAMKDSIKKELTLGSNPDQDAKIKSLESSANALLGQSHQFIKFYYDLESKVLNGQGKLSSANYYSYQAIGQFVDNLLNVLEKDGIKPSTMDGNGNRRLLSQDFIANTHNVSMEVGDANGTPYLKYINQPGKLIEDESYNINLVSGIANEERMNRAVEVRDAKKEAGKDIWSIKNFSKTAVLSAFSSTFALAAKGLAAIQGSEKLIGTQAVGVDVKTKVITGAIEESSQYLRLQEYIQTEAHSKLYDTLSPDWLRSVTERLGVDKPIKGVSKWVAKNYANFVVENQNSALNSLPEAVKQGFQNVSPVDAQFRKGMNMGANGGVRDQLLQQGAKVFNKVRDFDFGSKVPYSEAIKRIANSSKILSGVGSVLAALPILKKNRLTPSRVDTASQYDIKAGQSSNKPQLDNPTSQDLPQLNPAKGELTTSNSLGEGVAIDTIKPKMIEGSKDIVYGEIVDDSEQPLIVGSAESNRLQQGTSKLLPSAEMREELAIQNLEKRITLNPEKYLSLDQTVMSSMLKQKLDPEVNRITISEVKPNNYKTTLVELASTITNAKNKKANQDVLVMDITQFNEEQIAEVNQIIDTIPMDNNLRIIKYNNYSQSLNPALDVQNIIKKNLQSGLVEGEKSPIDVNILYK
jgi:hypothetical protein